MKNIFLLLLIVLPSFSFAQNIDFEKVINENIELDEFEYRHRENYIRYFTLGEDYVLRFKITTV